MYWYHAYDKWYYSKEFIESLKAKHNVSEIYIAPNKSQIELALKSRAKNSSDIVILSPQIPPKELQNTFVYKHLENKKGVLTTQEYEMLEKEYPDIEEREKQKVKLIENKLGLRVIKPSLKMADVIGMNGLKKFLESAKRTIDSDLFRIKGIFLVGLPGTGKSYTAKAFAGELNRVLIELNLSRIMEDESPVLLLHYIFKFLEEYNIPNVLWIDEIEKMFTGEEPIEKKLLGQLLTIINDLNTPEGYKVDTILWATANDISGIREKNPEFLRKGRFDELFFASTPTENVAVEMFKYYIRKYFETEGLQIEGIFMNNQFDEVTLRQILKEIQNDWLDKLSTEGDVRRNRFVYTPAEIDSLVKEMGRLAYSKADKTITLDEVGDLASKIYPIQLTAMDKVKNILAFRELFRDVDEETEIKI